MTVTSTKATDVQVGGDHYKGVKYQHVEFARDNRLGHMEGHITKYVTRYKKKNGIQDLEKALHFTQLLYQFLTSGDYTVCMRCHHKMVNFTEFATANALGVIEGRIIAAVVTHDGVSNRLHDVMNDIKTLIEKLREEKNLAGA